jgi:hypothetical protein
MFDLKTIAISWRTNKETERFAKFITLKFTNRMTYSRGKNQCQIKGRKGDKKRGQSPFFCAASLSLEKVEKRGQSPFLPG